MDHGEVAAFVKDIPDLQPHEQKYIITYLYRSDANKDGVLSFDELLACVASFRNKAHVTVATHDASKSHGPAGGPAAAPAYQAAPAQAAYAQPAQPAYQAQGGYPPAQGYTQQTMYPQ